MPTTNLSHYLPKKGERRFIASAKMLIDNKDAECLANLFSSQPLKKIRQYLPDFNDVFARQWQSSLQRAGLIVMTDGSLRISRWEKDKNGKLKKIPQKVAGFNTALRMQDDILRKYKTGDEEKPAELNVLSSIEDVIEQANLILTSWKTTSPGEKEKMRDKLTQLILELEKCRNIFKVGCKKQINKAKEIEDDLGRINPGAMAARTVSALNYLSLRLAELGTIIPTIALRKEFLILEKRKQDLALQKAAFALRPIVRYKNGYLQDYEKINLLNQVCLAGKQLSLATISPNFEIAGVARVFLNMIARCIRKNDTKNAKALAKITINFINSDTSQHG